MIARKITYTGTIDQTAAQTIYDIVRRIEITGEIRFQGAGKIELDLEGDPSMIKLVQHQIERKLANLSKEIGQIPFKNYPGLDFYF